MGGIQEALWLGKVETGGAVWPPLQRLSDGGEESEEGIDWDALRLKQPELKKVARSLRKLGEIGRFAPSSASMTLAHGNLCNAALRAPSCLGTSRLELQSLVACAHAF